MLLMFDRWRKLLKSFYNPKTNKYDISKIPDIYDSIKYDAIHNRELDLEYEGVFKVAHKLAEVVIPSEYVSPLLGPSPWTPQPLAASSIAALNAPRLIFVSHLCRSGRSGTASPARTRSRSGPRSAAPCWARSFSTWTT